MRIGILVYGQPAESTPEHFLSKGAASQALSYFQNGKRVVERISKNLLRICVQMTFSKLKSLLRNFRDSAPRYAAGKAYIPQELPASELPCLHFADPVKKPVAPRLMFLSRAERTGQYEL